VADCRFLFYYAHEEGLGIRSPSGSSRTMAAAPFHLEFPGGIKICDTGNTVVRSRLRKMGCSSSRCNSNSYRQCNRGIQQSSSLLVSLSLTSSMRRGSEGGSVSAANTGVYCFSFHAKAVAEAAYCPIFSTENCAPPSEAHQKRRKDWATVSTSAIASSQ
jgi:hypothetical protein